jgi:formylglycine-generating enzyme required for sulfatase activity
MKRSLTIATLISFLWLVFGSILAAQPAGEPPKSPATGATSPAGAQAAYPLWDGKETIAQYARRAGIKQTEVSLDLGNGIALKATLIPAGKFLMGSSKEELAILKTTPKEGQHAEEQPRHEVTITRPFYMGIYAVTQEQYSQIMGKNPSTAKNPKNPVETVPWDDAVGFAKKSSEKAGKTVRLPTEAEWEFACRAGAATPFYTGETISVDQANYDGSATPFGKGAKGVYRARVLPVGSFKPNAWGLYDMAGNVGQWVADWFDQGYYAASPPADPKGPQSGAKRVYRGGASGFAPGMCRSASRDSEQPTRPPAWLAWIGFRVVVEVP